MWTSFFYVCKSVQLCCHYCVGYNFWNIILMCMVVESYQLVTGSVMGYISINVHDYDTRDVTANALFLLDCCMLAVSSCWRWEWSKLRMSWILNWMNIQLLFCLLLFLFFLERLWQQQGKTIPPVFSLTSSVLRRQQKKNDSDNLQQLLLLNSPLVIQGSVVTIVKEPWMRAITLTILIPAFTHNMNISVHDCVIVFTIATMMFDLQSITIACGCLFTSC